MGEYTYELTAFFLKAADECYAGGGKKTTIVELPGSKFYTLEAKEGSFQYRDVYFTNGDRSGGQTTIFDDGKPVWLMQYMGWCQDDDSRILDFLKAALRMTYRNGIWCAGRGPEEFCDSKWNGLRYVNSPDIGQDGFAHFSGTEQILDLKNSGKPVFWHEYQGQLLVQDR